jgi:hypothetical protein
MNKICKHDNIPPCLECLTIIMAEMDKLKEEIRLVKQQHIEANNGWQELRGSFIKIQAERDKLKEALRRIEWSGWGYSEANGMVFMICPDCKAKYGSDHHRNCIVSLALATSEIAQQEVDYE